MRSTGIVLAAHGELAAAFLAVAVAGLPAAALASGFTTFSNGTEGWVGPSGFGGITFIDTANGNPAPSLRTQFNDFGITFYNNTNPGFIGDYTTSPQVDFTVDTNTTELNFLGSPTPRTLIVELRDYDNVPPNYPWVSVWTALGVLNENNPGWLTWAATILDTSATELPSGWGGYGAEGPFGDPMLPPNRTFTDVLASVDEIALSTYVPGYFYSGTYFDVALDNIGVAHVPEPTAAALLLVGGLLCAARRR